MDDIAEVPTPLFELTGVGVVQIDQRTRRFVRVNKAFCAMVGYGEAELRELSYVELTHPADRGRNGSVRRREGRRSTLSARYLRKDGSTVWLEAHLTTFHDKAQGDYTVAVVSDVSERKRAEDELKGQQEMLQKVFDHIPVMISFHGQDGRPKLVNREWERVSGWSLEELRRQDVDILAENYPDPQERQEVLNFIATAQGEWADFRPRVRDGQVIDAAWANVALSDGTSVSIGIDITARKRAEKALSESEEKYRTLFENSNDGFCILEMLYDEDGQPFDYRFLETNPAFEKQSGLTQAIGKTARDFAPNLEAEFLANYQEILTTGEPLAFEIQSADLERCYAVSAYRRGEPQNKQLAVFFTDITERKRAEERLRTSEEWLRQATEAGQVFVWEVDLTAQTAKFSENAERVLGFSLPATVEENFAAFHPEDRSRQREVVEQAISSGGSFDSEHRILSPAGGSIWVRASGAVVGADGGAPRLVGITQNITERKRNEVALKDFNATLEQRVEKRTNALKHSEQRFSQVFHVAPIAACMMTLSREIFVEVNEAFLQLTGYTREEVEGRSSRELSMWSSPEDQQKLGEVQRGKRGFHDLELRVRTKDGRLLDILVSGAVIQLNGHRGHLRMFYDITQRKQTEEEMNRAIQDVMSDTGWFSHKVMERLAQIRSGGIGTAPLVELSQRELQVLERVARGLTNDDIAAELGLAAQTVRNYISTIYEKTNVHSRAGAVVWARERGII